ncbi:MAG: DMT family transporter [Opitutales bacterium]
MDRHYLILLGGVFACSTAIIFVKLTETDPVLLSAYRMVIGGLAQLPFLLWFLRKNPGALTRVHLGRTILPAVLLAAHFISWILGARMTDAANATLIVNFVPVVLPFLLWLQIGERITGREVTGTGVAMIGLAILVAGDYRFDPRHFVGDLICFGSMLVLAGYLACGRRNRDFPSLWAYLVPVNLLGSLMCLAIAPVLGAKPVPVGWREGLLILGLGIIPTVLGHGGLNLALKHLRGQVVALGNLGQFLFASVLALFFLAEIPKPTFYLAGPFFIAGAVIVIRSHRPRAPVPVENSKPG